MMNKEEGYTLVEVLVAITTLGITMLLFSNFMLNYQQELLLLENKVVANNLARLKLEELGDSGLNSEVVEKKNQFKQEGFGDYFYTVEIIKKQARLKEIKIRIYYYETELINLSTFV